MKNNKKKIVSSVLIATLFGTTSFSAVTPVFAQNSSSKIIFQSADPVQDATDLVVIAETTKLKADIDTAQSLVTVLPDGTAKSDLQSRLSYAATNSPSVLIYEPNLNTEWSGYPANTVFQTNVNFNGGLQLSDFNSVEISLYNGSTLLATNTSKPELFSSNPTSQGVSDLFGLGDFAEPTADPNWDIGEYPSTLIPTSVTFTLTRTDGSVYTVTGSLDATSTNVFAEIKAADAVVKAEASKLQADVDAAKTLVTGLTEGTVKTDLQNRLDTVQTYIDQQTEAAKVTEATNAVIKAETSKSQADVDAAQTLVNALAVGQTKTDLQARLDVVKSYLLEQAKVKEATDAVTKAEKTKSQTDVNAAQVKINSLPDGTIKTSLQKRLDVVKTYIVEQAKVKAATDAVVKAEKTKLKTDVSLAQSKINLLANSTVKTTLQKRLDALKVVIAVMEKVKVAKDSLVRAEHTKAALDVIAAENKINALPNGNDKTYLKKRLSTLKAVIKEDIKRANDAIVKAQKHRTKYYKDKAQYYVNKLGAGYVKNLYQKRLNAIHVKK